MKVFNVILGITYNVIFINIFYNKHVVVFSYNHRRTPNPELPGEVARIVENTSKLKSLCFVPNGERCTDNTHVY